MLLSFSVLLDMTAASNRQQPPRRVQHLTYPLVKERRPEDRSANASRRPIIRDASRRPERLPPTPIQRPSSSIISPNLTRSSNSSERGNVAADCGLSSGPDSDPGRSVTGLSGHGLSFAGSLITKPFHTAKASVGRFR